MQRGTVYYHTFSYCHMQMKMYGPMYEYLWVYFTSRNRKIFFCFETSRDASKERNDQQHPLLSNIQHCWKFITIYDWRLLKHLYSYNQKVI